MSASPASLLLSIRRLEMSYNDYIEAGMRYKTCVQPHSSGMVLDTPNDRHKPL